MTLRRDCGICRGSQVIRLPIHPRMAVLSQPSFETVSDVQTSKEFPCPECSPQTTTDKVDILESYCQVSMFHYEADSETYMRQVKDEAAHGLLHHLLKSGHIRFEMMPGRDSMTGNLRATLGTVSKSHVASIEERARKNQEAMALEVIEDATPHIQNWNSKTADGTWIRKVNVFDELTMAVQRVTEKRKTVKEI